ncbi:MAG: glycerol-3-phosphate dehydrogenase [Streptosporangiaceae bacterium]|nr:Glycerol-3-phosphate dehydrogenase [Streptosporangiaceae bacterium]MDX6435057.1 glycerol-3-phosphate dehydrogenase [Streptosporangiaceae bacterium]
MSTPAPTPAPALAERQHLFERLGCGPLDLLVVGGGVNGLAIAWDAALAGLSVAVVDKGDWGSGTSSWSSRMIHGGLKYLENYDVRMVRESLRDREWLLRTAPHLVKPLPFVLPFYRGNAHSKLALRLGMIAYDVLSFDKSLQRHENFSREELIERLPGIRREGLQGASRYYDAQVEYAERLCVELMIGARQAGATAVNYARVSSLCLDGNRVAGARVLDELTGVEHTIEAKVTINVAGAWADDIVAGTPAADRRWIGGTKGTHLVVAPFEGAPGDAMYYESDDGRPMMVIPWLGRYLIGSTDKRFSGDLDTVSADEEELDYILHETNKLFPKAGLSRDSILYWYTGVRPLPYVAEGKTADISRRHEIHDHAPVVEGLLTVVGGKLTTFRALATHALAGIRRKVPAGGSRLDEQRLPGYATAPVELPADIVVGVAARLHRLYGGRAREVAELMQREPESARVLDPATQLVAAEVLFAVRNEQAVHLADVLARRVMVGLEPGLGRGVMGDVAEVMAGELGWDAEHVKAERAAYEAYLCRFQVIEEATVAAAARD